MSESRKIENLTPEQQKMLSKAVFEQWDAETSKMRAESDKKIWDTANIKPSDIGVKIGPVMDEKMFAEYKSRQHGRLNVISADQLKSMMGRR